MLTALLSRTDVTRHVRGLHLLAELRRALEQPLGGGETTLGDGPRLQRAWLPDVPATLLTTTELARGEPRSLWQLRDGQQRLLAVLEASALKLLGSSVLAALAADLLAPQGDTSVALLGHGPHLSGVLKSLRLVRPLVHAFWWEPQEADAIERAMRLQQELSLPVTPVKTPEEAFRGVGVVVAAPGAQLPVAALEGDAVVLVPDAAQVTWPKDTALPKDVTLWSELPEAAPAWARGARRLSRPETKGPHLFAASGSARLELLAAWYAWLGAKDDETITRLDLEGER
ncbi:MAG: hypothetical protein K1X89_27120 [Myxococcaceae bacterium]|nr:hypothetical protein [Myxococcaceae bacterium]